MKLKEYLENLQKLVQENPEVLDYKVIYAIDDEGNRYQEVEFTPIIGIFEDREFIFKDHIEEWEREESEINSICIN